MIYDNFGSKLEPISRIITSNTGIIVICILVALIIFGLMRILSLISAKSARKKKNSQTNNWFSWDDYRLRKAEYDAKIAMDELQRQKDAYERREKSRHPKKPDI